MSENSTPETASAPAEGADAPPEGTSESGLPQWAQKELTKLRNEAAANRVAARDAKKAAEDAAAQLTALTDTHNRVSDDLIARNLELTKLRVALSVDVPGGSATDFAELLQGSTEEEIRAHADKVLSVFRSSNAATPDRPVDRSQGLSGGTGGGIEDEFGALLFNKLR